MNKKGFTLIEILAVIVILSILALIVTPIVMNIIDDVNKKTFEETARNTARAAEMHYASSNLKNLVRSDSCYIYNYSNDVEEKIF